MKSRDEIQPLTVEQRAEIKAWRAHASEVPSAVLTALAQHSQLTDALASSNYKLGRFLLALRMAMGIIPKSEKRKSGNPIGGTALATDTKPRDPLERLRQKRDRHTGLSDWHQKLAKSHKRKAGRAEDKLKSLEEIELTPEEVAEAKRGTADYIARLQLGDGKKDAALEPATEAFMSGGNITTSEEYAEACVDPEVLTGLVIEQRLSDERTRYDFNMNISRITVEVEKLVVRDGAETRVISGSTRRLGPQKSELTWGFLANLMILASQYSMPFNRLGTLLSSPEKKFTSQMLSKWFAHIGERFVPIYLFLARELANADVMSGDDTGNRVIEISRYFKALGKAKGDDLDPPWKHYATCEAAAATLTRSGPWDLGTMIGAVLPFVSNRLDGRGSKVDMHTSVVTGRGNQGDPRSNIVFYRSHFGGLGNMLNAILSLRDKSNAEITIQSDLATVNLVSDGSLLKWLSVNYAGCTSHARRTFAQHEDEDPDSCAHILHLFKGLYIYERGIDVYGRNTENTLAVRGSILKTCGIRSKSLPRRCVGAGRLRQSLGNVAVILSGISISSPATLRMLA